ncbi:MAG: PIN domain-containing protein, partial [Terriglobia bacterium]
HQPVLMSVVNWGEVYYSIWRKYGEEVAHRKLGQIAQLPLEVVDVDMEMTKLAASFKARYKLPYADAFAAALAQQRKAVLITGDNDFAQVEKQVSILWTNS